MKKILAFSLLLLTAGFICPAPVHAQSVAINADSSAADASAILDLKSTKKGALLPRMTLAQRNAIASPATGLLIYQTDTTPGYYYYDGSTWIALKSTGSVGGTDANWSAAGADLYNKNTGNVIIGTGTALSKLTVQTGSGAYGLTQTDGSIILSTYVGGGSNGGWLGTRSNHPLYFFTNNSPPRMTITSDGLIGMGIEQPVSKLQIGNTGSAVVSGFDISYGNGNQGTGLWQAPNYSIMRSNTDIIFWPKNNTGNVGINTTSQPANNLEIGNIGNTGFNGNHIAMGNGSQALGIAQTGTAAQFASTTDVVFLPKYGTSLGRVGINTTSPSCPLDVAGSTTIGNVGYYWYYTAPSGSGSTNEGSIFNAAPNISIHAQSAIFATEYDAFSDARIKDIHGVSDAKKDLQTLNALHVTDYTMKDKVMYGNRPFKKVIAQEVEKVYPQVITKHPDFIPNVLKLTNAIEKTSGGYLLHFATEHHLTADAKRLRVISKEQGPAQEFNILSIPSLTEVLIAAPDLPTATLFVYGQEVPDFRTVDYEGLSTLNISATQELSKEVDELKRALKMANENILKLAKLVQKQHAPLAGNRLAVAKMGPQKSLSKKSKRI